MKCDPLWGWLGKPPESVAQAGFGMGQKWHRLSIDLGNVLRQPAGQHKKKALEKIDWEKRCLIHQAEAAIRQREAANTNAKAPKLVLDGGSDDE